MDRFWIFALSVAIVYTRDAYAQANQQETWENSWVAMSEVPQQSNTELIFSSNKSRNNSTDINGIIEEIIDSRREGRNLGQYSEVYADSNVDNALQQGNDAEARNLIRDKLCFLGLMSCDQPEKRPQYIMPHSGGPQPMRYLNYNSGPRPPFQQTFNHFGPPRKTGFNQPYSPNIYKPLEQNSHAPNAIIYGNRPVPSNSPPYIFKQPNFSKIRGPFPPQQNGFYSQQSTAASSNVVVGHIAAVSSPPTGPQQHVHHHFHHVEGPNEKVPTLPANQHGAFTQQQLHQSLANIGGLQVSAGTGLGGLTIEAAGNVRPGFSGAATLSGGYTQAGHGHVSGSFHSQNPGYYKKELQNVGGITVASNGFNAQNFGPHNIERQQNLNCFCVPFNQCPAADRIGRKEDLLLPIDPRNLAKDIEASIDETYLNATKARGEHKLSRREASPAGKPTATVQVEESSLSVDAEGRAYYGTRRQESTCRPNEICCRRPLRPANQQQLGRCGTRNAAGITGRIKNPVYVDGDSEFGEYPWHVAILKKDPKESIYACGATLIDALHVITAAHCIKAQNGFDLRARLGEWDVNHDVEFFPYVEREIVAVHIHPEYYAGTLDNDLALLRFDQPVDFQHSPHISPACLPDKFSDFTGARCWTTGWGKDAFGEHGKYQNILKEVDVPILSHQQCETQLRQTRLGYGYKLNPGFLCAGGEEGKDACKGDGGGPLACERNGIWNVAGVVSWGIGCGQANVPGVYVRVAHYVDWIRQLTHQYK